MKPSATRHAIAVRALALQIIALYRYTVSVREKYNRAGFSALYQTISHLLATFIILLFHCVFLLDEQREELFSPFAEFYFPLVRQMYSSPLSPHVG